MGGLGVCKSGEECIGAGSALAPAVSGQIKSALMYHFAGMSLLLTYSPSGAKLMSSGYYGV